MLKFASLLPEMVADCPGVSMNQRNELYMLYQAGQLGEGGSTAETAAKLEQLKVVMGMSVGATA